MFKANHEPIEVVVTEDRYECYGPPTNRSIMLTAVLKKMGGVSDTVPPGTYQFNVRRNGFKIVASLDPKQ